MAFDKLKIKYELHYWQTNLTGSSQDGWESFLLKGIYFPTEGAWGDANYRVALGMDWMLDLGDHDKGIGNDAHQLGPFAGLALALPSRTTLIPLVQQFISYSGEDINTTAFRLIAIQPLPAQMWLKLDGKVPIDWENDEAIPATAEVQLGKNLSKNAALYIDGLVGIGGDRPFEWGAGVGLRVNY